MALTADDIFKADDLAADALKVDVPEWGGAVLLRRLTCDDKDKFYAKSREKDVKPISLFAWVLTRSIVGDDGNLIFVPTDAAKLAQKSALVVERLFDHVQKINGMTPEAHDEKLGEPAAV